MRSVTGERGGSVLCASLTGPGAPPQMSCTSRVARSSAVRVIEKSTPRSKRHEDSEVNPSSRDLPAI